MINTSYRNLRNNLTVYHCFKERSGVISNQISDLDNQSVRSLMMYWWSL